MSMPARASKTVPSFCLLCHWNCLQHNSPRGWRNEAWSHSSLLADGAVWGCMWAVFVSKEAARRNFLSLHWLQKNKKNGQLNRQPGGGKRWGKYLRLGAMPSHWNSSIVQNLSEKWDHALEALFCSWCGARPRVPLRPRCFCEDSIPLSLCYRSSSLFHVDKVLLGIRKMKILHLAVMELRRAFIYCL